jgi:phage-related protein
MRGEITWAGVALSSLGNVLIEEAPETNRPARKVDRYEVPGRNGDIVVPQNAWENVTRSYELVVYAGDYNQMTSALMEWLYAPSGYQRLEDSFDALVYRLAYVSEATDIENLVNENGRCTVSFECDPRRFLKAGESAVTLSGTGTITNPTRFTAKPVITVSGSGNGTIECGGNTITIAGIYDGMTIDCEQMDAYAGTTNLNNLVSGSFPVIPGGEQTITITGGITSISVVPNWWTL